MSHLEDDDLLKTQTPAAAGLIAGRYKVVRELGSGGMGSVLLVEDVISRVQFALKRIPDDLRRSAQEVENLGESYRLVQVLNHPHIANYKTLDVDQSTGGLVLLMEYVDGLSLLQRLKAKGCLASGDAVRLLGELASALDYAHSHGVLHRDIKPSNVMISAGGAAKLVDFGLAAEVQSSLTRVSLVSTGPGFQGTRPYMAPELWRGKRAGSAVDQWALAATIYHAVAGDPPWLSDDMQILGQCIMNEAPDRPDGISDALWAALERGLAKDPKERWANCMEFAGAAGRETKAGGVPAARILSAQEIGRQRVLAESRRRLVSVLQGKAVRDLFGSGLRGAASSTEVKGVCVQYLSDSDPHRTIIERKFGEKAARHFNFVRIPAGSFLMGSPNSEVGRQPGETQHSVIISESFEMMATPVTQALWTAVMGDNPSRFLGDDLPVDSVRWDDCQELVHRLNESLNTKIYGLPTEAQWEYACRAGTLGQTYAPLDKIAWYGENSGGMPHPVGWKIPNMWGLNDMQGNVWEWCEDCCESWNKDDLTVDSVTDPKGPQSGRCRVTRGGSWNSGARVVRAALRFPLAPNSRSYDLSFRLVRSAR